MSSDLNYIKSEDKREGQVYLRVADKVREKTEAPLGRHSAAAVTDEVLQVTGTLSSESF